ncbi:MAG: hypothetical protein M4579_005614 [Chaenotheca gracillima]|nr:MAG: hypothetical protein M4579_005614 [Chaenotheca gracillima]
MASSASPGLAQVTHPDSHPTSTSSTNDAQPDTTIQSGSGPTTSPPVEMTDLAANTSTTAPSDVETSAIVPTDNTPSSTSNTEAQRITRDTEQEDIHTPAAGSAPISPVESSITPSKKEPSAIGASMEQVITKDEGSVRTAHIILLLTSGARHPYKIDERYLKKRNVNNVDGDPFSISVYTLKELIWREWRDEWEARSSSPSSIRLIHFGRLLDDNTPLKDCRFNIEGPNVVHMTVKPQEIVDEEDAKASKKGINADRDGTERTPRCRCVIL